MNDEPLSAFRDSARTLIGRTDQLARIRALRAQTPAFERAVWRDMAEAGWLSILVPEAEGGLGLGLREVAAIAEQVGAQLLPEPFVAAGVQAVCALCAAPGGELRRRLLEDVCAGNVVAGLAWQERAGQFEEDAIATSATPEGDAFVLRGEKRFALAGADGWIVSARVGAVPHWFWVPATAAGIAVAETRRVDGSLMARLTLDGVRVDHGAVLAWGDSVCAALALANDAARIAQSAELLGVARAALALMLDYLKTRVQFGKPIGSFQALQHRAVDAYLQTELAAACLDDVLAALDSGRGSRAAQAARAKARCAHAAIMVTRLAVQFHGAIGFTDECAIGFYLKRALGVTALLGTAAACRRRYFALQPRDDAALETAALAEVAELSEFPRDADWDAMPEAEFRRLVRGFFLKHYPAQLRFWPRRLRLHECRDWYQTLSRQGWLAPAWPKQYGGMGLAPDKLLAYIEEGERCGVCRVPDLGLIMTGPILIQYGTEQQKAHYLPKIISGEHIWCQGYSEPNAGSDLASLRTEAVLVERDGGEEFVVTGQKIWTTWGHDATHIFMLVRTDKTAKKQEGISFLLVDLATPGVTVRPIVDIGGNQEFCEVFFDGVRVPRANLVGALNQGWTVAKSLLGFERLFVGSPKQSQLAFRQLTELALARNLFDDPVFAARYAELQLDIADLAALYAVYAEMVKRGEPLPPSVSLLKIWATETYARIGIFVTEAAEEYGAELEAVQLDAHKINVFAPLLVSTSATIYGGSSEIQRNILARSVLGLPA
jgi:alkylation response protein AidB-like acyl-CoA dehydrogenase